MRIADDDNYSIGILLRMRIPSLCVGLVLGFVMAFAISRFEEVLATNVQAVFFIPFVVYMAAAVGSQTQTIYTRDMARGKAGFWNYLVKESVMGLVLGGMFGVISGVVVGMWYGSGVLAGAVGLSMTMAVATAPLVALLVTEVLKLVNQDPAEGAGPIATVIQDTISVAIYGVVSSAVLLG